jgi:hypothetical protein
MWLTQGKSFAKVCERWRGQPSHSELNNVNERNRNFTHRFKELGEASGKRDSRVHAVRETPHALPDPVSDGARQASTSG